MGRSLAPVAPQVIPSPSKCRKREINTALGAGGCKRQRILAPIVVGIGPTIPVTPYQMTTLPSFSSTPLSPCSHLPSHGKHHRHRPNFLPPHIRPLEPTGQIQAQRMCGITVELQIQPAEPLQDQEPILKKSCSPFVASKLCKEWRVYKNTDGITTASRKHPQQHHSVQYEEAVSHLKLKYSDDLEHPTVPTAPSDQGAFDLDEWIGLMIRWIVMDDYAIDDVIEHKKFREFICWLEDRITERDLPDRAELTELIFEAYEEGIKNYWTISSRLWATS